MIALCFRRAGVCCDVITILCVHTNRGVLLLGEPLLMHPTTISGCTREREIIRDIDRDRDSVWAYVLDSEGPVLSLRVFHLYLSWGSIGMKRDNAASHCNAYQGPTFLQLQIHRYRQIKAVQARTIKSQPISEVLSWASGNNSIDTIPHVTRVNAGWAVDKQKGRTLYACIRPTCISYQVSSSLLRRGLRFGLAWIISFIKIRTWCMYRCVYTEDGLLKLGYYVGSDSHSRRVDDGQVRIVYSRESAMYNHICEQDHETNPRIKSFGGEGKYTCAPLLVRGIRFYKWGSIVFSFR